MWIKTGPHRLISAHALRLDSIQLRPITHSDSFALHFKGADDQVVNVGVDLEKAEALLRKIARALEQGVGYLDLSAEL